MSIEPFSAAPLGPDAEYLIRISFRCADGKLTEPFTSAQVPLENGLFRGQKELVFPEYGSLVDSTGQGIYGILRNQDYSGFRAIRKNDEAHVAKHYRWQVFSALRNELEVDWEFSACSRYCRRAWVLFTGEEAEARGVVDYLLERQHLQIQALRKSRDAIGFVSSLLKRVAQK
jgi:hypothetical protein